MKGHRDAKTGLTADVERFCLELVKPGTSQADAYRKAFPKSRKWKDESVQVKASKLAATDKVRLRVKELLAEVTAAGILEAAEVVRDLARALRFDPRKLYHVDGKLKAVTELDDDTALALAGVEVIEGPGEVKSLTKKLKWLDKNVVREQALKHFGLYGKDNTQKADVIKQFMEAVSGHSRGLPKRPE